jgi:NADPH:quinone reductase-like Zn-dependent oxidoreductase
MRPLSSRAWFVDRYGGPERLILRSRPDADPGPGQVRIRVAAIGLNFADLFVRAGVYPNTPPVPMVPGMEVAGVVEAAGPDVAALVPGQRVAAVPIFGGHAENVICPAARAFPLPPGMDFLTAAAMPVAFLTAEHALRAASVAEGERLVVTAAAGGVGTALLQLARGRGARTLALAGSAAKLALCRSLGAEAAATYEDAPGALDRHFSSRADAVIDSVGGAVYRKLWRRLDRGGRYVLYGFGAAAGKRGLSPLRAAVELAAMGLVVPYGLIQSCRSLTGFNLSLLPDRFGAMREMCAEILERWTRKEIAPVVGPTFPFEQLPEAHRALAGRSTAGKVVLRIEG